MKTKPSRGGRPPAGIEVEGKPTAVRDYARVAVYLPPDSLAQLQAMKTLRRQPAWRIIREALSAYLDGFDPADRKAVEALARRVRVAAEKAA